jgi:hypothetical protein
MLVRLAPRIQEHILALPQTAGRPTVSECLLRPLTIVKNKNQQLQAFANLAAK